jgi:catechol 2,3-dioxygenase-like lactoylglutathione lyase family enzyme
MPTSANDHAAVRVADIELSTRFYVDAFGAEIMSNPFVVEGAFAEAMMDGPPGVRFRVRHLRFGEGVLELFEFLEPQVAAEPVHASRATILHLGFRVEDVEATARRVESAGGRVLVAVTEWGDAKLAFCADPDGNVIEIADAPIGRLVAATIASFPEAAL